MESSDDGGAQPSGRMGLDSGRGLRLPRVVGSRTGSNGPLRVGDQWGLEGYETEGNEPHPFLRETGPRLTGHTPRFGRPGHHGPDVHVLSCGGHTSVSQFGRGSHGSDGEGRHGAGGNITPPPSDRKRNRKVQPYTTCSRRLSCGVVLLGRR